MIFNMHKMKLKGQIYMMVCICLLIIIMTQIAYFYLFTTINENTYAQFLENTIAQLSTLSSNFMEEINEVARTIAFNDNTYQFSIAKTAGERLRLYNNLQVVIDSVNLFSEDLDEIILVNSDLLYIGNPIEEPYQVAQSTVEKMGGTTLSGNEKRYMKIYNEKTNKDYYVIVTPSYFDEFTQSYINAILVFSPERLKTSVNNIESEGTIVCLVDDDNSLIASNVDILNGTDLSTDKIVAHLESGVKLESLANGDLNIMVDYADIELLGWKIIGITNTEAISYSVAPVAKWGLLMTGIVIILLLLFAYVINNNITTPISHITSFVDTIGEDYATSRLKTTHSNEIGILADDINKMLDKIDKLNREMSETQQKLYMSELMKKQADLAAFQSQVNPHFLYNTLDCIRGIALVNEIEVIAKISTSMSKIFRYSIKAANNVQVKDEIDCIKEYLNIIQVRHNGRFEIEYVIDESIYEVKIPKMIFQPLVENAIFHGLERRSGYGKLLLSAKREGGDIVFTISDNGVGMDPQTLNKLQKALKKEVLEEQEIVKEKSIGIRNIYQRLKLIYGDYFNMEIESRENAGTKISIIVDGKYKLAE